MIDIHIDYAADDSCMINLWARGVHEPVAFRVACEAALLKFDERVVELSTAEVHNSHWRTVKADAETRACGVCETVRVESQPGRGAYAVTVLTEWLELRPEARSPKPAFVPEGGWTFP